MNQKKLRKIIQEQIKNKLNEDSLEDSFASLNFSKRMHQNAVLKKLPTVSYWAERMSSANNRIKNLKTKGEKINPDIEYNIEKYYKEKNFKDLIKSPKIKQALKHFRKEFFGALTQKSIVDHSKHLFHKFNHNVEKHFEDFKKEPKKCIMNAGKSTLGFFKSSAKGVTVLDDLGKNVFNSAKSFIDKKKANFSEQEKEVLRADPDSLIKSFTNNLTPNEVKDFKNLGKTVFYGAWGLSFGIHVAHLGSSLANGVTGLMGSKAFGAQVVHEMTRIGGEGVKNHLLSAAHEGIINTIYGMTEPLLEQKEQNDSIIENLGRLTLASKSLIKYFTEDPEGSKLFLQAIKNVTNVKD
jgi:hypothetical protein